MSHETTKNLMENNTHLNNPAEFAEHVVKNIKEGKKIHSCCVDGRAEHGEASKPGADAGDFIVTIGALRFLADKHSGAFDPKSLFALVMDKVVEAVGGVESFKFHTDSHAIHDLHNLPEEESIARGCGHLKNAERDPAAYGLEEGDMALVFEKLLQLKRAGVEEVILNGEHGERGVIVINNPKIYAGHSALGEQAFVYHAGLDALGHQKIARLLSADPSIQSAGLEYEELLAAMTDVAAMQRGETLSRLADGKTIYQADSEDGKISIIEIGVVGEEVESEELAT